MTVQEPAERLAREQERLDELLNGLREAREENQAYDRQARHQLPQLSERLAGLSGPYGGTRPAMRSNREEK